MQEAYTKKLDYLGRVGIPKEIRSYLHWKEGCLLNISVKDDTVVITKAAKNKNSDSL